MGSNTVPFKTNLFLYFQENKWIQKTKRKDITTTPTFGNGFRVIDDLTIISNAGDLKRFCIIFL